MNIDFTEKEIAFLIKVLVQNYACVEQDIDSKEGTIANAELIGKVMSASSTALGGVYKIRDIYHQARETCGESNPTQYTGPVFMGSGDYSYIQMNKIHRRLHYGFCMLGGIQQNGGMGHAFDVESHDEGKEALVLVVEDVMTALGVSIEDLKLARLKNFK